MTIHKLYDQYQEGTIDKSKFLYEVRKKNLPYITKFNSFEDTISILKGKLHLQEKKEKNPEIPSVECKTIDMVSPHEYAKGMNFELKLETDSFGQNTPPQSEVIKCQKKVLRNLTKNPYYYTQKLMTDEEKKYEKGNEREYELKKQFIHNNKKGIIREGVEVNEDCGCSDNIQSIGEDKEIDRINMDIKDVASQLIREWGLTKEDINDEDIMSELSEACNAKYKELNELGSSDEEGTIETEDEYKAKELADQGIDVKLKDED